MNFLSAESIATETDARLNDLEVNLMASGASRLVVERVLDLIEGMSNSYLLPTPRLTCSNGWYGFTMSNNDKTLEVLFDVDSDDWRWYYTAVDSGITTIHSYEGRCSKQIEDLIFYWIPNYVLESMKLIEQFRTPIRHRINRQTQLSMLWATIRYDGLMAGFCYYNDQIHYYRCVEETKHEQNRLYALYALPWHQRVLAVVKRWGWNRTLHHTPLWTIYSWWFATHPNLNNTQKQATLANPDLLVGHFV